MNIFPRMVGGDPSRSPSPFTLSLLTFSIFMGNFQGSFRPQNRKDPLKQYNTYWKPPKEKKRNKKKKAAEEPILSAMLVHLSVHSSHDLWNCHQSTVLSVHHLQGFLCSDDWLLTLLNHELYLVSIYICAACVQECKVVVGHYVPSVQNFALQMALSFSPHRWWTSFIRSADLQMPLQLQSNDAAHTLPACAFHSQSGCVPQQSLRSSTCSTSRPMNHAPNDTSSLAYLWRTCWLIDI